MLRRCRFGKRDFGPMSRPHSSKSFRARIGRSKCNVVRVQQWSLNIFRLILDVGGSAYLRLRIGSLLNFRLKNCAWFLRRSSKIRRLDIRLILDTNAKLPGFLSSMTGFSGMWDIISWFQVQHTKRQFFSESWSSLLKMCSRSCSIRMSLGVKFKNKSRQKEVSHSIYLNWECIEVQLFSLHWIHLSATTEY